MKFQFRLNAEKNKPSSTFTRVCATNSHYTHSRFWIILAKISSGFYFRKILILSGNTWQGFISIARGTFEPKIHASWIPVQPNIPIIIVILLTAFHKFVKSRGPNTSVKHCYRNHASKRVQNYVKTFRRQSPNRTIFICSGPYLIFMSLVDVY